MPSDQDVQDLQAQVEAMQHQIDQLSSQVARANGNNVGLNTDSGVIYYGAGRASLQEADNAAYFSTYKLLHLLEADTATGYDLWRWVNGRYTFNPTVAGQLDMYQYFVNNGTSSEWGVYLANNNLAPTTRSTLAFSMGSGLTIVSTFGGQSASTSIGPSGIATPVLYLTGLPADPIVPPDGDIWYRSDTGKLYAQINGQTVELGASTNTWIGLGI